MTVIRIEFLSKSRSSGAALVKACVTPAQPHRRSSTRIAVGQVLHKPRGRKPRRPPRQMSSAVTMAIALRAGRELAACD